ncbi:MAG: type II toxin-antitoxin system RelE/ParE family toxin [Sphingomonas adhaesiva]|uniref:type II toxin-antitoxin system RelE/ParE family toxin n=1 Tax=Sphingomonas adhaesiva TaxID=28212 RepID=UPI002FFBA457
MASVEWADQALDDVDLIVSYIEQFNPAAARRVAQRLHALGNSLSDFPRRGRPMDDGTREMVTVVPYVLRYDTDGDHVFILSVRHGARLPD